MDDDLRNWARARRGQAGAGFDLHPVNRKLLHEEARRLQASANPASGDHPEGRRFFIPGFAFALSLCLTITVLAILLLPVLQPSKTRGISPIATARPAANEREGFAKQEAGQQGVDVSGAAEDALLKESEIQPAPARREMETSRLAEGIPQAGAGGANPALAQTDRLQPSPTPVAAADPQALGLAATATGVTPAVGPGATENPVPLSRASAQGSRLDSRALGDEYRVNQTVDTLARKSQETGDISSGGESSLALATDRTRRTSEFMESERLAFRADPGGVNPGEQDVQAAIRNRYTQNVLYRRNFNSPPRPDVLNEFVLEQAGRAIQITDADGSVYSGSLVAGTPFEYRESERKSAETASSPPAETGGGDTSLVPFQVTGTNRTLNSLVVFQGNLVNTTPAAGPQTAPGPLEGAPGARDFKTPAQAPATQQILQPLTQQVRGLALVGSDRIEINATQAPP